MLSKWDVPAPRGKSWQDLFRQQLLLADAWNTDFISLAVMRKKSMLEKQMSDPENNDKVKGRESPRKMPALHVVEKEREQL